MKNETTVNIVFPVVREEIKEGWNVPAGARTRFFPDDSANPFRGTTASYLAASKYAEEATLKGKRKFEVKRNYKIVDRIDYLGHTKRWVKITRPMGGYKYFLIVPDEKTTERTYTQTQYEHAIQEACSWFLEEREKCLNGITLKNTGDRNRRKSQRQSLLFGDPTLGLRPIQRATK